MQSELDQYRQWLESQIKAGRTGSDTDTVSRGKGGYSDRCRRG